MKVKDVIIKALRYVGREQEATALASGEALTGESAEAAETMLYCFNAVEDELARRYFNFVKQETFVNTAGKYEFSGFSEAPIKILDVSSQTNGLKYTVTSTAIVANVISITVTYRYAPSKQTMDGEIECKEFVSEKVFAAGAASEYCLINGEVRQAEFFEEQYRQEIDVIRRNGAKTHFPPRRWV